MAIKMSELVTRSGVPKSTILYYIKEGLLPQPQKMKQNVCLYDESFVEIIKLIRFLQATYSKSISEIKISMQNMKYDFSEGTDIYISFLEKLSGTTASGQKFNKEEFLKNVQIDEATLSRLLSGGFLVPLVDGIFDEKDMEIAKYYGRVVDKDFDLDMFSFLVDSASQIAVKMMDLKEKMGEKIGQDGMQKNEINHLIFEIPTNIKPYIVNRHMIKEHKKKFCQ